MPQLPNIPTGRTRLAPTPSGYLHVGNAFNFLLTERLARSSGSRLLLRIDDLDQERVRPEYIEDIFRSLEWLGITWDEGPSGPDDFQRNWSQRLRLEKYRALAARLRSAGHTYACVCSRAQLEALRSTGEEHACRNGPVVMGRVASVRLRIPDPCPVRIMELSGAQTVDLHHEMPDPVMEQRGTGRPAYQLTSLCDDVAYGVTFLVRGRDLVAFHSVSDPCGAMPWPAIVHSDPHPTPSAGHGRRGCEIVQIGRSYFLGDSAWVWGRTGRLAKVGGPVHRDRRVGGQSLKARREDRSTCRPMGSLTSKPVWLSASTSLLKVFSETPE